MSRDVRSLRAALAGAGFIGAVHAEALRRLGIEIAGVLEPSDAAAAALGVPRYRTFEALLDDPQVDVVHLATPNHLHHEQAAAAIGAGKHVVCEKPLALTTEESGHLAQLAHDSGLVCAVNFMSRFYPQAREMRALRAQGALGDVWSVHGSYLQDWLLLPTDWNWRLEPEVGGALRAVADIGSHWLDLAEFVAGSRVAGVFAETATMLPTRLRPSGDVLTFAAASGDRVEVEMTTEDAAYLLLRFENGAHGSATISQVSAGRKNALSLEVDCSQGAVAWCSERPEELWIGHRGRPNELLLRDPSLLEGAAARYARLPGGHAEGFADTFRELFRAVYTAAADGGAPAEPDYPTFDDGHHGMLLGDAVLRSAATGQWADVAAPVPA